MDVRGKLKRNNNKIVRMLFILLVNIFMLLALVLFVKYGIEPAIGDLKGKGDGMDGL